MAAAHLSCLLAALSANRPLASFLALGLFVLFILFAILVWTRFGQARPVSKCVVLSLLAHLLLVIYAYSTHILNGPPGSWTGRTVTVRLRDAADDLEAAPAISSSPKQWEQPGESNAPLLLAAEAEKKNDKNDEQQQPAPQAPPAEVIAQRTEPAAVEPRSEPEPAIAKPQPPAEQPQQIAQSPPPQPNLVDLFPDGPALTATAAEPAPLENPLRGSGAKSAETLAANEPAGAPLAGGQPPQDQFVIATKRPAPRRLGDGRDVPETLQARVAADRLMAAQPFGATAQTETAVAAALDWLARAQSSDGRWDADAHGAGRETKTLGHDRRGAGAMADTGITGLALLAFLGSGETHLAGKHRESVQHGLEFLLGSQAHDGNLAGNAELFAAMYCHGMATLALGEAYALSGDDRLVPGLQRALEFSISAQNPGGGWRYRASEPSDPGDMSQFGWQLMALKSAELGGIPMPTNTRVRMVRFLQSCSIGNSRGLAGYRPGERASRTMTAEALVCRHFLDAENAPAALDEGAAYVMEERPRRQSANYYFWYYGTLAMFQRKGDDWQRWNAALQAELLARQRWDGPAAGSYDADDLWGGYGGRVYSTSLAALSLEVYYRYIPVHGRDQGDSRLTDRAWQPALPR